MSDIPTPGEARDWILSHPERMTTVSIEWRQGAPLKPAAKQRLLEILFRPDPVPGDSRSA